MIFKKKQPQTVPKLDPNNIPAHIAFIMDGNGRWAKKRNMPRTYGHHEGTKTIRTLALEANRLGVKAMTVYAFSTENFARPQQEVEYIFKLPKEFFNLYLQELMDNNVQIRFIGDVARAPQWTQDVTFSAVERTPHNPGLILCFAFIYGSRQEIVEACKQIAMDYKQGDLTLDEIDEDLFESYMMSADLPPVDLLVRTSGECRLSNFMLWQLSYAELYFSPVLWPDFDEACLHEAIIAYQHRDRRFGGLKS